MIDSVTPEDFTEIVLTARAAIIQTAINTAHAAGRLVFCSEPELRKDNRVRIRLILRNR